MTPLTEDPRWTDIRRRRRYASNVFWIGIPTLIAVGIACARLGTISLVFWAAFGAWFVAYTGAVHRMKVWPCPKCGGRFGSTWGRGWPPKMCVRCGIRIGEDLGQAG